MSNAYAPCHCLPDSAGYLGLVELFVRRRCQIARRLSGQSDQPNELDTSLVSCAYSNSARGFRQYINGRANPAVCLFCCFERSITDAYPSPYAVTPTIDHGPPAHHAVAAIGVRTVVRAAVRVIWSGAEAESEREPGPNAPAPTAAAPAATAPPAAVPTAPSGIGGSGKCESSSWRLWPRL